MSNYECTFGFSIFVCEGHVQYAVNLPSVFSCYFVFQGTRDGFPGKKPANPLPKDCLPFIVQEVKRAHSQEFFPRVPENLTHGIIYAYERGTIKIDLIEHTWGVFYEKPGFLLGLLELLFHSLALGDVLEVYGHTSSLPRETPVVEPAAPGLIKILKGADFSGCGPAVFAFQLGTQREGKNFPVALTKDLFTADI